MTDQDYQTEQELRAQTRERGAAKGPALILADFYEQHGQPSRAWLWRQPLRVHAQRSAADLVIRDPEWQRKVMMWLLSHVISLANIARAFRRSVTAYDVEVKICEAANMERHHPTMAATLRLQAAGALPGRFTRGTFELGEAPPESWPVTRAPNRRAL